jgi:hypothetical protein
MVIKDLLHKRILIKESGNYSSKISEVKVLEISPSGNWTKLMNMHGMKYWVDTAKIAYIETLIDLKTGKPKN